MKVLFLGGPAHDTWIEVATPLPPEVAMTAPAEVRIRAIDEPVEFAEAPEIVRYVLRHAAPGGIGYAPGKQPQHPVYVHPDYDGPARW